MVILSGQDSMNVRLEYALRPEASRRYGSRHSGCEVRRESHHRCAGAGALTVAAALKPARAEGIEAAVISPMRMAG